MRTFLLAAVLIIVSGTACAIPGGSALAAEPAGFLSWALDRGGECDMRWNLIANTNVVESYSSLSGGTGTALGRPSVSEKASSASKLSHSIISTRSFFRSVERNAEFLPLSTRERGNATRGSHMLENPAHAHLATPYDVKRPLNSSVQQKNFFARFGGISRPKLNSFGRISSSDRLHRGAVSRPACRAARPRIL